MRVRKKPKSEVKPNFVKRRRVMYRGRRGGKKLGVLFVCPTGLNSEAVRKYFISFLRQKGLLERFRVYSSDLASESLESKLNLVDFVVPLWPNLPMLVEQVDKIKAKPAIIDFPIGYMRENEHFFSILNQPEKFGELLQQILQKSKHS